MANNLEYFWFLKYTVAVKKFLKNSLHLKRLPEDKNVQVFYTTPSRAFAKFIVPVINGSNLNPTITFQLLTPNPAQNQTTGGYFMKYQQSKDNPKMFEKIQNLLTYTLTYRVTMWAAKRQDMDILLYQAATSAPFNNKYSVQVDGQWAEMQVLNMVNETNLDPGESQDLAVRYSFEIKIPRAYLPLEYEEYYGIIESTDVIMDV